MTSLYSSSSLVTYLIILLVISTSPILISSSTPPEQQQHAHKICTLDGGLTQLRLLSSQTRHLLQSSIDDVEFIRHYLSESLHNGGISGGLHSLDDLSQTLNITGRQLSSKYDAKTTVEAGLGYVDDRYDRRVERFIGMWNFPIVGSKEDDMAMIDGLSNVFPWMVDRRSSIGSLSLDGQDTEEARERPWYSSAWIGTYGEAWLAYPPLNKDSSHPMTLGDRWSGGYDSRKSPLIEPNLPWNDHYNKQVRIIGPYTSSHGEGITDSPNDTLRITVTAPVYYTGQWRGNDYRDEYMASTGVDISSRAISALWDDWEEDLSPGSVMLLVDMERFIPVALSSRAVERLYPEEYSIQDTVTEDLTELENANWSTVRDNILSRPRGSYGHHDMTFNITFTGDINATECYLIYERWDDVADWALMLFIPRKGLDEAIVPRFTSPSLKLKIRQHSTQFSNVTLVNDGRLDIHVSTLDHTLPEFITPHYPTDQLLLPAGSNISFPLLFNASMRSCNGYTGIFSLRIQDASYPDCDCSIDIVLPMEMYILPIPKPQYLDSIIAYGITFATLITLLSIAFSIWVKRHSRHRIIRASQPLFLHMITIGTVIMSLSLISLSIDDRIASPSLCSAACIVTPWLLILGFGFSFSALFAKIWRINRIFHAAHNCKRVTVSPRDVLVPLGVVMVWNVGWLTAWTVWDPPKWTRVGLAAGYSYGTCWAKGEDGTSDGVGMAVCLSCLGLGNFIALVLANVQAYRSRFLSDEYSECRYVAFAMASILQIFVVGVPTIFLVKDKPKAYYYVVSSIVAVICLSLLLLIFIPKIIKMRKLIQEKQQQQKDSSKSKSKNSSHNSDGTPERRNSQLKEFYTSVRRSLDAQAIQAIQTYTPRFPTTTSKMSSTTKTYMTSTSTMNSYGLKVGHASKIHTSNNNSNMNNVDTETLKKEYERIRAILKERNVNLDEGEGIENPKLNCALMDAFPINSKTVSDTEQC